MSVGTSSNGCVMVPKSTKPKADCKRQAIDSHLVRDGAMVNDSILKSIPAPGCYSPKVLQIIATCENCLVSTGHFRMVCGVR